MSFVDVEGVIKKAHQKTGSGKRGPWTKYSLLLDVNGEDKWINFGFDSHPYNEGQVVKVRCEEGQYGLEAKQHKLLADKPAHAPGNSSSGGGGNTNLGMTWGNISNVAASLLETLAAVDGLPLTGSAGKANKAKRYDELMEIFDKLRVKLYHDALDTSRVLDNVADEGAIQEEEPKPLPDQDEVPDVDDEGDDDDF